MDPKEFLDGHPVALSVYEKVSSCLADLGPFDVRTSKSQITFRRKRGFAHLWLPGQYLKSPDAEVVLSIALDRHDRSERFKEVAHPAKHQWMHHLEVHKPAEINDEVVKWLREALEHAS